MEFIGTLITYLMMACCVAGGISYIVNDQSELGRAFQDGLHAMANMFIPICGLMASVPFLKVFISKVFGPVFALFGGDPVVAAAIIMPPDCGSFALATEIGQSADLFPVIIAIGFMCASTIAFNVPIGLSMLDKGDHKYLALGTMSGFLSVPFGVFITSVIVMFTHPAIRSTFSSVGEPDHVVVLTLGMLLRNMIPLVVICVLLALGLKFFPNGMVKGFMVFGKLMTGALTLVVVACILQHYTGLFTDILGVGWGFDPILADEENTFRAVELLGTIAMMLTGAFPMVTLIRRYLGKPLEKLGRLAGLEASGSVGLVACLPNGLAMFPFVKEMRPGTRWCVWPSWPAADTAWGTSWPSTSISSPICWFPCLWGRSAAASSASCLQSSWRFRRCGRWSRRRQCETRGAGLFGPPRALWFSILGSRNGHSSGCQRSENSMQFRYCKVSMNQLEACPGLCGPRRPQHENAERGAVLWAVKIKAKRTSLRMSFSGGDDRTRICDPLRVKQVLYRLSYASIYW